MMNQVKYYIASGALRAGDQLPSIRECALTLRINPTTVVKAYADLQHEGVLEMKHGKGAFVAASVPALPEKQQEQALRRTARQLAVEAAQMGMATGRVIQIVKAEMDSIKGDGHGRNGD
jgi:GntR family transcriptional regulator